MLIGHFSMWLPSCQINWVFSFLSKLPLCDSEVFLFSKWCLLITEFYSKCFNISSWLKSNQRNQTALRSSPFAFTCCSGRREIGFFFNFSFSFFKTGQGCQLQRHWKPLTVVFLTVEILLQLLSISSTLLSSTFFHS